MTIIPPPDRHTEPSPPPDSMLKDLSKVASPFDRSQAPSSRFTSRRWLIPLFMPERPRTPMSLHRVGISQGISKKIIPSSRTFGSARTFPLSQSQATALLGAQPKNSHHINLIKWALILIRLFILITPVLLTVNDFHFTLFWISWALNILLVAKFFYLLHKRGRTFFKRTSSVIDIFSTIGVFGFGLAYCITELSSKPLNAADLTASDALGIFEILWSLASFSHVFGILVRLESYQNFSMIFNLFRYGLGILGPFIFTLLIAYYILAVIGESIFGGKVSSDTLRLYAETIGPDLKEDYVKMNWNDHTNSLIFLYSMALDNKFLDLMNMTLVSCGTERDWRAGFFVVVFVLTKMLLLNIFQGFFISIFLQFYGKEKEHEMKKKTPKKVTKKDFRFEMSKFFIKKSGRKIV